jgi:3-oxoacyl-[acyl-carrier-protein] synthase-1
VTDSNEKVLSWSPAGGDDACICGIGARTPLGLSSMASAAAVRGAISAVAAHSFFVDKVGEPMNIACDAVLAPTLDITERLRCMLLAAVSEAVIDLPDVWHARTACMIGLPEIRPGIPPALPQFVSAAVGEMFGSSSHAVQALPHGHAAGLMALQAAAQTITAGRADVCVALGADSYHSPDTLEWLDGNGSLMSSVNRNGFPPGEGAGACVIAGRAFAERHGLPVLAQIVAAATGFEPNSIQSTEVCIGAGLTAVLRNVLATLQPSQAISATYCDLNGQRYRSEEFSYTLLRVQQSFVDAHDYESPADCWGDLGAASGPLFACLAIVASQRGYAKGEHSVLWAGSASGHRTAVVLRTGRMTGVRR